jgi:hypothetical protein
MEKTIKIGKQEVRLTNNVSWAMTYRDQFGHDIIPTLMPMLAAALDIVGGLIDEIGEGGQVEASALIKALDGDRLLDAMIHLSGLEFVELINITWAMAKACDDDLPDPKAWAKSLEEFPVDTIAPEVFSLAFKGLVSSKNLKRLKNLKSGIKVIQPSTSTPSSSQDSSEG